MDHTPYSSRDLDQTRAMLTKYRQQAEYYADHHPRLAEAVEWVFAEADGLLAEIHRLRAVAHSTLAADPVRHALDVLAALTPAQRIALDTIRQYPDDPGQWAGVVVATHPEAAHLDDDAAEALADAVLAAIAAAN